MESNGLSGRNPMGRTHTVKPTRCTRRALKRISAGPGYAGALPTRHRERHRSRPAHLRRPRGSDAAECPRRKLWRTSPHSPRSNIFSPLTAQIYLPALTAIAEDLNVTSSQVNLTITTYMIFQGITPMFIGSLADSGGRRPAYLVCFVIYIAANIGLALAPTTALSWASGVCSLLDQAAPSLSVRLWWLI